jgi:pimeloyl-ACP methyl ester carboxylesterase
MKTELAVLLLSVAVHAQGQSPTPVVPPDNFFDSGGVRIRYVEQGQGSPIVLIHGYTGTLERHWINPGVFANLASDHRVIAFDCRGHGKSGKPHEAKAYGVEMGQDVIRLLDHLKIARAHVIGYSMGAIIAGHLLTTDPDRFITATFIAHHAVHTWTAEDEREAEASARELQGDTPFKSLVVGIAAPGTPVPSDEEIRKLVQPLVAANDLAALAAYHRGRSALVVTDQAIAAVRVPTLGIIGSADPLARTMRELGKIMPALKVVIVDGAEHGGERGIMRRPEFMETLRPFLAAHRPPSLLATSVHA